MGWRFRKSISVGKTLRINLSKRGAGISIGVPGLRVGLGADGKVRKTVSIPGTGIRKTEVVSPKQTSKPSAECARCGAKLRKADKFCSACGSRVQPRIFGKA